MKATETRKLQEEEVRKSQVSGRENLKEIEEKTSKELPEQEKIDQS